METLFTNECCYLQNNFIDDFIKQAAFFFLWLIPKMLFGRIVFINFLAREMQVQKDCFIAIADVLASAILKFNVKIHCVFFCASLKF